MNGGIYFDNSATTYPKPPSVRAACLQALDEYGGNPGRSGHKMSLKAAEMVYETRELAAKMFSAEPENVIFTQNCTHALNTAIKGISAIGNRAIISSMEHNSVVRPVYALAKKGLRTDVAVVDLNDCKTAEEFTNLITPATKMVVCTAASNATGKILPIEKIASACKLRGVPLIVDAAQAAGVLPLKVGNGINFICCAGHKGLYGPTGTGLLISDGTYALEPLMHGGTGATSQEPWQTPFMPELLESGTLNTVGICGLKAGLKYVEQMGICDIFEHERYLCDRLISQISTDKNIEIYSQSSGFAPIVLFNVKNVPSQEVANALSKMGFMLRGGLHCAFLAHKTVGTLPNGAVRFSPSVFNSQKETDLLANAVKKIAKIAV